MLVRRCVISLGVPSTMSVASSIQLKDVLHRCRPAQLAGELHALRETALLRYRDSAGALIAAVSVPIRAT